MDAILCQISGDIPVAVGQVREIAKGDGVWEHSLDVARITEIGGEGDDDGMWVEVLVCYEGYSEKSDGTENVHYSRATIQEMARMVPGVNGYKGHPDPSKKEFEYREPVCQYVAARTELKDIDNEQRLALYGKAFISRADTAKSLRIHLREGLAGPVSIHGKALFAKHNGVRSNRTVGMHSLQSIDFCNPGTPGLKAAGVTAVVTEIQTVATRDEETAEMSIKSKSDLRAEYGDLVDLIVRESVDAETASLNATVSEMREKVETAEARATEAEKARDAAVAQVTEMQAARDSAVERAEAAEGTVREMKTEVRLSAVRSAFDATLDARAKGSTGVVAKVLEMARSKFTVTAEMLVEDDADNAKTLEAVGVKFDAHVGQVTEMARALGIETEVAPTKEIKTTVTEENPKGTKTERTVADLFNIRAKK